MFVNADALRKKIQENKRKDFLDTKRGIVKRAISDSLSINESIAKVSLTKEDLENDWLEIITQELQEKNYEVSIENRKKLSPNDIIFADLVIDWS